MPYREFHAAKYHAVGERTAAAEPSSSFQGNDAGNAPTLLMLGGFKFSIATAVFQEFQRSTSYRWAAQERMGQFDALQFTGPGDDRITLPGTVYPDFRGGDGQLDDLRSLAAEGRPMRLISSTGAVLGEWVVDHIEEVQSFFWPDGRPRRQDFTVSLRKFGDDADV
jgi:phage protein U